MNRIPYLLTFFFLAFTRSLAALCHLDLPKNWECIRDKGQLPQKVEVIYLGASKGAFTPSVNVASEVTALTAADYMKMARRYHESQGDTRCSPLGTIKTQSGEALMMQIDRTTQWGPMRFIQAAIIKDGTAFVITATCLHEEFAKLSAPFFKAIQTFAVE